jgi:hypothetical protein
MWCIPQKQNAEFVVRMEDVLEVYAREYKASYPVSYIIKQTITSW